MKGGWVVMNSTADFFLHDFAIDKTLNDLLVDPMTEENKQEDKAPADLRVVILEGVKVDAKAPGKKHGGKHEVSALWSAAETAALAGIIERYRNALGRPQWKHIGEEMQAKGFAYRSPCSVRNHWRRKCVGLQMVKKGQAKNRCTVCRAFKAGHVCMGVGIQNPNEALCPKLLQ